MPLVDSQIAHLLRRAGFGLNTAEAPSWNALSMSAAIDRLVDYEASPGDVDDKIGTPGYIGTVSEEGPFSPNTDLIDAMQRWMFRLIHSERPLQEKMALFWHDHFATGIFKISDQLSFGGAVRAMAAKPGEDTDGVRGQLELFREHALGNFRDLLIEVSRDPAMVAWLDGDTNTLRNPQENYARELMELFTIGVDQFTEDDVYAGARVFTGWNLDLRERGEDEYYANFLYRPLAHDTEPKTFSFPIYPDGSTTIPGRSGGDGYQDGIDLINALAAHPATGPFLARKLYAFFVNDKETPDQSLIDQLAAIYYASGYEMKAVVRALFQSPQFQDTANHWGRYSWPAEFVARAIKEIGWSGFAANHAVFSMFLMGQTLFDPPNVAGWPGGPSWFSTSTMLARANFAAFLTWNQRFELQEASQPWAGTPDTLLAFYLDRLTNQPFDASEIATLRAYLTSTGPWTGAPEQVTFKGASLAHLIASSGRYQFV